MEACLNLNVFAFKKLDEECKQCSSVLVKFVFVYKETKDHLFFLFNPQCRVCVAMK